MLGDPIVELKKVMSTSDIYSLFIDYIPGILTHSPFRDRLKNGNDSSPSLIIEPYKDEMRWRDFGKTTNAEGDGLDFVAELEGVTRTEAAIIILTKLKSGVKVKHADVRQVSKEKEVVLKDWDKYELDFWRNLGVQRDLLDNVYPIEKFFVNGYLVWETSERFPIFQYSFGPNAYQVYAPMSDRGNRHRNHNTKHLVFGMDTLPETGKNLLITKSKKDILVLQGINVRAVVAPPSETNFVGLLANKDELERRFENIYVSLDPDPTGRDAQHELCFITGWKPLNLDYPENSKDPADIIQNLGCEQGQPLLRKLLIDGWKSSNTRT
jgi:hypothetical protein